MREKNLSPEQKIDALIYEVKALGKALTIEELVMVVDLVGKYVKWRSRGNRGFIKKTKEEIAGKRG
jgi:hypothetical protein